MAARVAANDPRPSVPERYPVPACQPHTRPNYHYHRVVDRDQDGDDHGSRQAIAVCCNDRGWRSRFATRDYVRARGPRAYSPLIEPASIRSRLKRRASAPPVQP